MGRTAAALRALLVAGALTPYASTQVLDVFGPDCAFWPECLVPDVDSRVCRKHALARAYRGGVGDCFEIWRLREHRRVRVDEDWLESWCTPQRERLLRRVGAAECRALAGAIGGGSPWNEAMAKLHQFFKARKIAGGGGNNGGGGVAAAVVRAGGDSGAAGEPEFEWWRAGFDKIWAQHAFATELTPRNSSCPWVVDVSAFSCGSDPSCGRWFEDVLFARRDVVWISVDPHDHLLARDDAPLSPSVAFWPECRSCGRAAAGAWPQSPFGERRFTLSFQGRCQEGFYGSSQARPALRRLLENYTDPRVHFKCKESGGVPASAGFDGGFFAESLNASYVLVPHGHGRWNYRFSEAVAAGAIPVVVADGLKLPLSQVIDWNAAAVRLSEADVGGMTSADELLARLPTGRRLQRMREAVFEISNAHFHSPASRQLRELALVRSVRHEIAAAGAKPHEK